VEILSVRSEQMNELQQVVGYGLKWNIFGLFQANQESEG
jgi:hypothetical protein